MSMTRVIQVIQENPLVATIILDMNLNFQPGQFVMVWCPRIGEKPYTIASKNSITVKFRQGPVSWRLCNLKPGDQIGIRGPLGNGFKINQNPEGESLIVAGGTGLACVSPIVDFLPNIIIHYGEKTFEDQIYKERLKDANLYFYTEDGTSEFEGYPTDDLAYYIESEHVTEVYCCGPKPLIEKTLKVCRELNVHCQVAMEAYMKCAIGLCGSCTCGKGLLVCKDGPVFESVDLGDI